MGFCSGTQIFDPVVEYVLKKAQIPKGEQFAIIKTLVEALEDHDWDCQQDSAYWDHPAIQAVMKDIHPEWDEQESNE